MPSAAEIFSRNKRNEEAANRRIPSTEPTKGQVRIWEAEWEAEKKENERQRRKWAKDLGVEEELKNFRGVLKNCKVTTETPTDFTMTFDVESAYGSGDIKIHVTGPGQINYYPTELTREEFQQKLAKIVEGEINRAKNATYERIVY